MIKRDGPQLVASMDANPTSHVCLVSAQASPNLTAALDPSTMPSRVIMLVSPDMQRRADWLGHVLRTRGIKIDRWAIDDAWDIESLEMSVLELLEQEQEAVAARTIALNATGGTKPMSIAAYEAFRAYDLPIFYVHPERDRLVWMHPTGRPAVDLENRVNLEPFMAAHGARVQSSMTNGVPRRLRALTSWLIENIRTVGKALGVLNWLAKEAEKSLVSPQMDSRQLQNQGLQALIDRFARDGVLEVRGKQIRFPDEGSRFYVNGGWLEEHVYALLRSLRGELPQIQDLARSVEIRRETNRGDEVPNELDVVCLAENRLYLVECKTRVWSRGGAADPGADALYRLDTLSDLLGGLQARAMLVSYRELPVHEKQRAADLQVRVCAGARLRELPADLRNWIR